MSASASISFKIPSSTIPSSTIRVLLGITHAQHRGQAQSFLNAWHAIDSRIDLKTSQIHVVANLGVLIVKHIIIRNDPDSNVQVVSAMVPPLSEWNSHLQEWQDLHVQSKLSTSLHRWATRPSVKQLQTWREGKTSDTYRGLLQWHGLELSDIGEMITERDWDATLYFQTIRNVPVREWLWYGWQASNPLLRSSMFLAWHENMKRLLLSPYSEGCCEQLHCYFPHSTPIKGIVMEYMDESDSCEMLDPTAVPTAQGPDQLPHTGNKLALALSHNDELFGRAFEQYNALWIHMLQLLPCLMDVILVSSFA